MSETRGRFLRSIAERIAPERVHELHLFHPLRQAGQECGIAVIAASPDPAIDVAPEGAAGSPAPEGAGGDRDEPGVGAPAARRMTVYRARYRLVLKGSERGRWETDVTAEADAPLEAVDDVVRGVLRRAGDETFPERLTGDDLRAALSDGSWTATR